MSSSAATATTGAATSCSPRRQDPRPGHDSGMSSPEQPSEASDGRGENDAETQSSLRERPSQGWPQQLSPPRPPSPAGPAKDAPQDKVREHERVAQLETDMAAMEQRFRRELDRLTQSESESVELVVSWQNRHKSLNKQFFQTDAELRVLRSEAGKRDRERDDLRRRCDSLQRDLKDRDALIRSLQRQVRGLKEFVSTSTRTEASVSDEELADGMTRLGNGLQNWVIMHFRKAKLDLSRVDEATLAEVSELVPRYEELAATAKVHLLQSLVARILVETVFDAYFVGLKDDQSRQLQRTEALLSSFASSDEPVNQWRSSTLALLRREGPDSLQGETDSFTDTVVVRINRVLTSLLAPSPTPSAEPAASDSRDSALRALVQHAIELARVLRAQRALLRVDMPVMLPEQRMLFEPATMEDIGGEEDEAALARREIRCVTFPALIKRGDESGGSLHFENVITRARVLCCPDDS